MFTSWLLPACLLFLQCSHFSQSLPINMSAQRSLVACPAAGTFESSFLPILLGTSSLYLSHLSLILLFLSTSLTRFMRVRIQSSLLRIIFCFLVKSVAYSYCSSTHLNEDWTRNWNLCSQCLLDFLIAVWTWISVCILPWNQRRAFQ